MSPEFNINRPKISDDEINTHKDFESLVKQFKEQSVKQARGDESWWKNKRIRYSTVIAGITVVCTVTYFSLFKNQPQPTKTHETVITQKTQAATSLKSTAFINPPSQKLKINYSAYTINNGTGGGILHSTGSKIKIPKNSFADKNGLDVVGDVTIEYKEFHDLGDVIASGIPMKYDSAGTITNFETAGMFDIRGTKDGDPVFIKSGKHVEVELASKNNESRFNQYYLDTLKKNWFYIKKDKATAVNQPQAQPDPAAPASKGEALVLKNTKLNALKHDIDVVLPKKIDSVKVLYTAKIEKLPRAKEPAKPAKSSGKPVFQIESDVKEFPELAAFKNAVFEVGDENKNYCKELHTITWSDVNISQGPQKGKNYLLTLSYRNRVEKLVVYPVLQGADYAKAKEEYDQKLENYQSLVEKKQADEKRLLAEMEAKQAVYVAEQKKKEEQYKTERAKLLAKYNLQEQNELASDFNTLSNKTRAMRIFNVSRFGVYNSDCPHPTSQGAEVSAQFIMREKGTPLLPEFIYLVDHTAKTVYRIDLKEGYTLKYDPLSAYSICAFAKNKMFLCSKDQFKQTVDKAGNHFEIAPLPDGNENLADFKKALEL